MAGGEIEIVPRAIKIGRHRRYEIATVFAPIGLTKLEPSDLGNGIPFIGGFKRSREQRIFLDRLWCHFRIDAGGAEKQQLFNVRRLAA